MALLKQREDKSVDARDCSVETLAKAADELPPPDIGAWYRFFHHWMFCHALPLWARQGQDERGLGFVEHLALDASPANVSYKRLRVQTRQTYVFSHAALLGWHEGLAAARNGYTFFTRAGALPEGGYARVLSRDGGIIDPAVCLYENAFALFAMAWYARATGDSEPVERAHRLLDWMESHMAANANVGGFENALPIVEGPRQQNPHMHLLEALLALYETTGERRFAQAALRLLELFRIRLFDPSTGTLAELYASDWSRLGTDEGRRVEPGHLYEWAWLLSECARLLGDDTARERIALYQFAERHGVAADSHLVIDAVDIAGQIVDPSTRVWPQAEAIKAHLVMGSMTGATAECRAARTVAQLVQLFLTRSPPGTWIEHLWPDGSPKSGKIPATTLYHLFMAFGEFERRCPRHFGSPLF